jgi:hypothetical protein
MDMIDERRSSSGKEDFEPAPDSNLETTASSETDFRIKEWLTQVVEGEEERW